MEGGARIALIESAQRMNEDAQGALLKTLEEPPAGVTIILCADDEDRLLPTIRSRCARLRLGRVGPRDVEAILADDGLTDAPLAGRLARLSAAARAWRWPRPLARRRPAARRTRPPLARSLDRVIVRPAGCDPAGRSDGPRPRRCARCGGRDVGRSGAVTQAGGRTRTWAGRAPRPRPRRPTVDRGEPPMPTTPDETARPGRSPPPGAAGPPRPSSQSGWTSRATSRCRDGRDRRRSATPPCSTTRAPRPRPSTRRIPPLPRHLDRGAELVAGNVSPELVLDYLVLAWPR